MKWNKNMTFFCTQHTVSFMKNEKNRNELFYKETVISRLQLFVTKQEQKMAKDFSSHNNTLLIFWKHQTATYFNRN